MSTRACDYAYISVFKGGCNPSVLQCVAAALSQCKRNNFYFDTTLGTTYHVLVHTPDESVIVSIFSAPVDNVPVPSVPAPVPSVPAPVPVPTSIPASVPVSVPVGAPAPARTIPVPVGGSCPAEVTSFTLVDTKRATDIMPLQSYAMIDVPESLNIRANILDCSPKVIMSVYIDYDNMTRCERFAPYTVFGDASLQDVANGMAAYRGKAISTGSYIIKATPYTNDRCLGAAGKTHTLEFTVA